MLSPGEEFRRYVDSLGVPILDIGNEVGATDYIDFIKPERIKFPVMKGVDSMERPFLMIKAIGITKDGEEKELFQTFFQRYTRDESLWMGCGHYGNQLFETTGGMRKEHFDALVRIINKEIVTTEDFYRTDSLKIRTIKLMS